MSSNGHYTQCNGLTTRVIDTEIKRVEPITMALLVPAWQRQPISDSGKLMLQQTESKVLLYVLLY